MTDNSMFNTFKSAFAPVTEAFKNIQNVEVPEATRDFLKRAAGAGKERSADTLASAEKVTAAVESALSGSVSETAKISRNIQNALHQDAEAYFAGIEKLASATSLNEAFQLQSDYFRDRGEVAAERAKSTYEYFGKMLSDGAKTVQDNVSKVVPFNKAA